MKTPLPSACTPLLPRAYSHRGFTLVELLVVIGLIGILSVALVGSFGYLKTSAWQSRAQAQVSNAATALTAYLQKNRSWPDELLSNTKKEFDADVCAALQRYQIIDVSTWKTLPSVTDTKGVKNLNSPDQCGLLDPWGRARIRKILANGGDPQNELEVETHRLQYRLDEDFDGYVDAAEGAPKGARVRGSVLVWSRGPDGLDDADGKNPKAKTRYPYDDRLSWSFGK